MPKMSGGYKNRNVTVQVDGKFYELDGEGNFECDQEHVDHYKSVGFKRVFDFKPKVEEKVVEEKVEPKVEDKKEVKVEDKVEVKKEDKVEDKVENKKESKVEEEKIPKLFSRKKGK